MTHPSSCCQQSYLCSNDWNPEFIHIWSDTSRPLRHRQRNDRLSLRCWLPWLHHGVTWITCSPLWRSLIHRILKSLLPQNNTFFIATVSVDKDAADDLDYQGLREQWYYLRFYVRRTMPPTGHLVKCQRHAFSSEMWLVCRKKLIRKERK